ncbi:LamG domain-containing protein [Prevotella sp. 10(H)]|uniref:LamG domain-containing protein n=1 Tax=Prevotella sp. 10(H) TaxID=1158294 RepID=UPI000691D913|nr:LamG domain-containing protein [Prevotella sp. 10(H)]
MELKKYIYPILAATLLMFTAQSCFQDMDHPAFNYPEEPAKPPINEEGQILYLTFEDNYKDEISGSDLTVVGTPGFSNGRIGKCYAGAADSYLTFKTADFPEALGADFSVAFWYKLNSSPDRAGIISIGPVTPNMGPEGQNNRTAGIRLFREQAGNKQRIKANFGNGTSDGWLDSENADLDPAVAGWKHIAFTLTKGKAVMYIDGVEAASGDITEVSWQGCDIMSIASGAPRFTEWGHLSDNSSIDQLRVFNRTLTLEEVKIIILNESE